MMKPIESRLELLRSGIRVSERFKLLERLPRWVAGRRFLAQREGRTQREQLLFWELEETVWTEWLEKADRFVAVDHPCLLRPRVLDDFQGLRYMVAREVRGPSLEEKMETGGALLPSEIRRVFAGAVDLCHKMVEAGLPGPPLDWGAILLEENAEAELRPVFFPWEVPGFPASPAAEMPLRLRDFLLSLGTHRMLPFDQTAADWESLPPAVRALFPASLRRQATWETLAEAVENLPGEATLETPESAVADTGKTGTPSSGAAPTSRGAGAAGRGRREPVSGRGAMPSGKRRNTSSRRGSESPRRPGTAWKKLLPAFVVVFLLGGVSGWFFHRWYISIPPEAAGWQPADLRQVTPLEAALVPPSLPAPPSAAPSAAPRETSAAPVAGDEDGIGSLEEDMLRWEAEWTAQPEEGRIVRGFTGFLEQLEFHRDALRAGRMPQALAALERAAAAGFPPARYLLGQVLYGRETLRAETIMVELARQGHEGAQAWCVERAIEWE